MVEKKQENKEKLLPKILAITGKYAEQIVRENLPAPGKVKVLPINIAAFITSKLILRHITKKEARKYDLLMVPGIIQEDLSDLSEKLGIQVVKGPRYASDIKRVLKEINPYQLSAQYPADKFLKKYKKEEAQKILLNGYQQGIEDKKGSYYLGQNKELPISLSHPPIIMAEIVDATVKTMEAILTRAKYYLENGAQIIDIGAVANDPQPNKIRKIIADIRKTFAPNYSFCLSIDSLNVDEIHAACKSEIDLVLSIDHSNVDELLGVIPKETGIVFIPTNVQTGFMPKSPAKRIDSLLKIQEKLIDVGYYKLAADPIIEMPIYPGFSNSLEAYIKYRQIEQEIPMMTCVGNVTEFISADAIGVNALFAFLAVELGIQLLLMTDVSVKCRGGIKEIAKARDLAFVAKNKQAPPKGHGINILMAKSRVDSTISFPAEKETEVVILTTPEDLAPYSMDYQPDPQGNFTIWTDYYQQKIFVAHQSPNTKKVDYLFVGTKARPIIEELIKRKLISKLDHAFYLGRELERAEISLYLGKTYTQNEQTFSNSPK